MPFAHAQLDGPPRAEESFPVKEISRAQFGTLLDRLQKNVADCRASVSACRPAIDQDNRVAAEGASPAFIEHWNWLRDAIQAAAKAKPDERTEAMNHASEHLDALRAESSATSQAAPDYGRADKKAAEVLARSEFRMVAAAQPSWLDRKINEFWMWFGKLFLGARRLGEAAPWLGKLLEWGFFVLAGAGLLLFIRRNFARQQLTIAMGGGNAQGSAWDREANDWAAEAEAFAAKHAWRDAVHCLYWAAIVKLEARRAWRHNPSRTPREYVRLLQPGSQQQSALRGLTGVFERVWYGLREAEPRDYERAHLLFKELSQNNTTVGAGAGNGR